MRSSLVAGILLLGFGSTGCQSSAGDPVAPLPGSGGDGAECAEGVDSCYPLGPYGADIGSVIEPLCFDGYVDPSQGTGEAFRANICLADLYNPTGDALHDAESPFGEGVPKPLAIMVNVGAVWCGPCKEEADKILPPEYAEYNPQGMELISVLTDSETLGVVATFDHLDAWVSAFDSTYPSVIDPTYQTGALIDTTQYPANFLIDARTMEIAELLIGKPGDSFFVKLEGLLETDE